MQWEIVSNHDSQHFAELRLLDNLKPSPKGCLVDWGTPLGWGQQLSPSPLQVEGWRMLSSALFSALSSFLLLPLGTWQNLRSFHIEQHCPSSWEGYFISSSIKLSNWNLELTDRLLFAWGSSGDASKLEAEQWSCFEGCNWETSALFQPSLVYGSLTAGVAVLSCSTPLLVLSIFPC